MSSAIHSPDDTLPSESRLGNDPWHSSLSVPPEELHNVQRHTRELRTTDEAPTAPRVELLFQRGGGVLPQQIVVVWDPGRNWPGFSMQALAAAGSGELTEIRLRRERHAEPLLILEHTLFKPAPASVGVMLLRAMPDDPVAMRLALSLLAQASRALILAGSALDSELARHVRAQLPDHKWKGPPLLMISPTDRPSRAQRLRRLNWPAGLRTHVLELFKSNAVGWSSQLIEQVVGATSAESPEIALSRKSSHAPRSAASRHHADPVQPPSPVNASEKQADQTMNPTRPPADSVSAQVLALAAAAPGVCACALVDSRDGAVLAQQGQADLVHASALAASRLWLAYDPTHTAAALDELNWRAGPYQHLVLPVMAHPGLLLVAVVDREFGDPAQSRWQLAVARNHFD